MYSNALAREITRFFFEWEVYMSNCTKIQMPSFHRAFLKEKKISFWQAFCHMYVRMFVQCLLMIIALLNNSAKLRYHPFRTKVRFVIAWKSFLSNPSFAPLNPVRILWSEEQSSLDGWCDKYELLKRVENNFAFYWKIFVPGSQTLCLLPNTQRMSCSQFHGKKHIAPCKTVRSYFSSSASIFSLLNREQWNSSSPYSRSLLKAPISEHFICFLKFNHNMFCLRYVLLQKSGTCQRYSLIDC